MTQFYLFEKGVGLVQKTMSKAARVRTLNKLAFQAVMAVYAKYPRAEMEKDDVLRIAIESGDVPQEWFDKVHGTAAADALKNLCRKKRFEDEDGNKISRLITYKKWYQKEGKEVDKWMMMPIEKCGFHEMYENAARRKSGIVADREHLKVDISWWNRNVRRDGEKRIVVRWD